MNCKFIVFSLSELIVLSVPSVLWRCWLGGRKGIRPVKKLSGGVLAWLSTWSEMQTCIQPSWCYCHSLSLASLKSRLVLYWLIWVVPDKGPLNGCVCVCVRIYSTLFVRGGGSDAASGYNYCSDLFGLLQDVMVVGEPTLMGGEFGDNCERLMHPVRPTRAALDGGKVWCLRLPFCVVPRTWWW